MEFLLKDPKIDRFENNSLKNDGFNGTHANDILEPTMQWMMCGKRSSSNVAQILRDQTIVDFDIC